MWEEVAAADSRREEGYEDGFESLLVEAGNSRRFLDYRHFGLRKVQEETQLVAAGVLGVGIDIVVVVVVVAVAVADHVDMVPAAVAAAGIDVDHAGMVLDVVAAAAAAPAAARLDRICGLGGAVNRLVQLAIQR